MAEYGPPKLEAPRGRGLSVRNSLGGLSSIAVSAYAAAISLASPLAALQPRHEQPMAAQGYSEGLMRGASGATYAAAKQGEATLAVSVNDVYGALLANQNHQLWQLAETGGMANIPSLNELLAELGAPQSSSSGLRHTLDAGTSGSSRFGTPRGTLDRVRVYSGMSSMAGAKVVAYDAVSGDEVTQGSAEANGTAYLGLQHGQYRVQLTRGTAEFDLHPVEYLVNVDQDGVIGVELPAVRKEVDIPATGLSNPFIWEPLWTPQGQNISLLERLYMNDSRPPELQPRDGLSYLTMDPANGVYEALIEREGLEAVAAAKGVPEWFIAQQIGNALRHKPFLNEAASGENINVRLIDRADVPETLPPGCILYRGNAENPDLVATVRRNVDPSGRFAESIIITYGRNSSQAIFDHETLQATDFTSDGGDTSIGENPNGISVHGEKFASGPTISDALRAYTIRALGAGTRLINHPELGKMFSRLEYPLETIIIREAGKSAPRY
ncbi:MAG: hypothetical protein OXR66_01225 [Candidatus Woesearchaeota archaeon]|nr:hypothetical protein [Candidatus Woesearchaeota archaeon]